MHNLLNNIEDSFLQVTKASWIKLDLTPTDHNLANLHRIAEILIYFLYTGI